MFNQIRCAALLIAVCCVSQAWGADPVTPMHLVGHEDIALLDRVQELIDDWDPRKLVNPVFENVEVQLPDRTRAVRRVLKRPDLAEFIADVDAAEALGKALFWDMQAGSDYRRLEDGTYIGTACASCHYRNGADARSRHTMRIPYVVWDKYKIDPMHPLNLGENSLPYDVKASATFESTFAQPSPFGNLSLVVGSAGVEPRLYEGNTPLPDADPGGAWEFEKSSLRTVEDYVDYANGFRPQWSMFLEGQVDAGQHFRQITPRNAPGVINSGFADRLFHDGRAESTFNGFSIFGDRDQRPVLWRGVPQKNSPDYGKPVQVHVAIPHAALASQAVGPILSDVEMSYLGRTFPNVACKLLDAKILPHQPVDDTDSVLGSWKKQGWLNNPERGMSYRQLIKKAFRREWWDGGNHQVPLVLLSEHMETSNLKPENIPTGDIMVANFPLYWGLSIMLYESSLVSNQSPFDGMMVGDSTLVEQRWQEVKGQFGTIKLDRVMNDEVPPPKHETGASVFQHGFRVFLNRGCIECHSGPLFSEVYERVPEFESFPINEQMETTLLPNSRSDAIAVNRHKFHHQTIEQVEAILSSGIPDLSIAQVRSLARLLDQQRELARGNEDSLADLIEAKLQSRNGTALAQPIAELLMKFEKNVHKKYGNRTFFTEDERVALAEGLVEPVLVESMPIPPTQIDKRTRLPIRPRMPIQGPFATTNYAFYDLGFYALGVAPPRYDEGVGQWEAPSAPDAVVEGLLQVIQSSDETSLEAALSEEAVKLTAEVSKLKIALQDLKDGGKKYNELDADTLKRLKALADQVLTIRPNPATPGASNRFRGSNLYENLQLQAIPDDGNALESVENIGAKRACDQGPAVPADKLEKELPMGDDHSWDRNYLPQNRRRSDLVFFSRARTLVTDENPWGYRKPFLHDNELAFWGAFKTPTLRNVELTAPYMHNGLLEDLAKVIEFYDDGGNFDIDSHTNPDKHPEIVPLDLKENDKKALRFFLLCLTDERVRREQAPFDHPSLQLVHGYDDQLKERIRMVPGVGAQGWTDPTQIPPSFPHRQ